MNGAKLCSITLIFLGLFAKTVTSQAILVEAANETDTDTDDIDYGDYDCSDGEFDCGGGECIPPHHLCDGTKDCGDGLDEKNCTEKNVTCSDAHFDCGNGICISKDNRCDGLIHCTNNADELHCESSSTTQSTTTTTTVTTTTPPDDYYYSDCEEDEYQCDDDICIKLEELCSGAKSCSFGETNYDCNETYADTTTKQTESTTNTPMPIMTCNKDQFQCTSGSCITATLVCDGKPQCSDSSDEVNCTVSTSTIINKILTHTSGFMSSTSEKGCFYNDTWYDAGTDITSENCSKIVCNGTSSIITSKDPTCGACLTAKTNSIILCFLALICVVINWK